MSNGTHMHRDGIPFRPTDLRHPIRGLCVSRVFFLRAHGLVVLHKSLAIDFHRAYDLRPVCDRCSPQRGSDMVAQRNALGTGAQ